MIRLLAAIALVFVTATVTLAQPPALVEAVITNVQTGTTHGYTRHQWPSMAACEEAIVGLDTWLQDIVAPAGTPTREATEAEAQIKWSVENLAAAILLNTGRMPRLRIGCKPLGDPA